MNNFLKVIFFSLLVISFFAGFSNFGIPQIKPAPPPKEEKLDLSAMSMDQFIALGEKILNGKGTCTLCHNAVGGRAPLLDQAGIVASERLADSRYQGKANSVADYLYESMVEPSAYVVTGFGKAGSNDSESPMPTVIGGGIDLSEAQIMAIIAYLQDSSGLEVTVEIPTEVAAETEEAPKATSTAPAPLNTPEEIIVKFTCGACHKVAGQQGALGPDLTQIGTSRDKTYLRRAILDPNVEV
ncbi:MAG: cytochrome C, partial [Rhodobacteraceae bacterium]|nr:cytochrome C [Paracoccaceae bacterium]